MPECGTGRCFASLARSVSGAVVAEMRRIWPGKAVTTAGSPQARGAVWCGWTPALHPMASTPVSTAAGRGTHRACLSPLPLPHTLPGPADQGDGEECSYDGSVDLSAVPWGWQEG